MSVKVMRPASKYLNRAIWLLFVLFFSLSVFLSYNYFGSLGSFRYLADLLLVLLSLGVLYFTEEGKQFSVFLKEAKIELQKVVWPTRPEIFQSVLAVLVMVLLFGVLVWCVDAILFWVVGLLANQYN